MPNEKNSDAVCAKPWVHPSNTHIYKHACIHTHTHACTHTNVYTHTCGREIRRKGPKLLGKWGHSWWVLRTVKFSGLLFSKATRTISTLSQLISIAKVIQNVTLHSQPCCSMSAQHIQVTSHGELSDYQIITLCQPQLYQFTHTVSHTQSCDFFGVVHTVTQKQTLCPHFNHIKVTSTHPCPSALPGDMMLPTESCLQAHCPLCPIARHGSCVVFPAAQGHGLPLPLFRNLHQPWYGLAWQFAVLVAEGSRAPQCPPPIRNRTAALLRVVANSFQTRDDDGVPQEWSQQSPWKAGWLSGSWPCCSRGGQAWDKPEVGPIDTENNARILELNCLQRASDPQL